VRINYFDAEGQKFRSQNLRLAIKSLQMINHKSFYYWNVSLVISLDSRLMKPQMKFNPSSCIFYKKLVNTLTPTLFQSKSFSFRVPTSHSPERNAKLAIRPKKTIKNIFVLIPVMKENKWYVNCLWFFFPSHNEHSES